jgi:hypothetical protein
MACNPAFARGLVGVTALLTAIAGCTSTGSNPGAVDGAAMTPDAQSDVSLEDSGPNACIDASIKLIQASDYDQSCTVDTDCRYIAEGNACTPCAFDCSFAATINVSALAQYYSDVANTPAVAAEFNGRTCASGCPGAFGPCCVGGKCQTSTASQCPAAAVDAGDAAADTGADAANASSDAGGDVAADAGPDAADAASASDAGDSDASEGASASSPPAGSGAATCNGGGCLCFSTSETCPSNCLKTHRADGSFVCGYSCDAPGVPCNCIYSTADGGIYVCDSVTMPACPANTSGACNPGQPSCMSCGTFAGPEECGCQTSGPFVGDAGPQWQCLGTEQTCEGP